MDSASKRAIAELNAKLSPAFNNNSDGSVRNPPAADDCSCARSNDALAVRPAAKPLPRVTGSGVERDRLLTETLPAGFAQSRILAWKTDAAGPFAGPQDKSKALDPGVAGSFPVCIHEFTYPIVGSDIDGLENSGVVYAPGSVLGNSCRIALVNCPVVLILHADGIDLGGDVDAKAHLKYESLGKHLASQGFIVISVNRRVDDNIFERQVAIVSSLLSFMNGGGLGIKAVSNNTIALIGHSAGGRLVYMTAGVPKQTGWTLKCLCLMAATIDASKQKFTGDITAFLGLNVRHDDDPAANGGDPTQFVAKLTTIKAFEDAGRIDSNNDLFSFEKHLLYVAAPQVIGHYFQDLPFVRAYISAFLHRYQKEDVGYQTFLRGQKIPPSVSAKMPTIDVSHLHEDIVRKVIVDIDSSEPIFEVSSFGVSEVEFGEAFTFDSRSLHTKRVMKFDWDRSKGGPSQIKVQLKGMIDASVWKLLSFNITQVYFAGKKAGPEVILEVQLNSKVEGFSRLDMTDYLGTIRYPTMENSGFNVDITRNGMRSVNIPIADFVKAGNLVFDITQLVSITFSFGKNPVGMDQKTVFMVNEIKLLH